MSHRDCCSECMHFKTDLNILPHKVLVGQNTKTKNKTQDLQQEKSKTKTSSFLSTCHLFISTFYTDRETIENVETILKINSISIRFNSVWIINCGCKVSQRQRN